MSSNFLQIGTWPECYGAALKAVGASDSLISSSTETRQGA